MPVTSQFEEVPANDTRRKRARAWNLASLGLVLVALIGVQQAAVYTPYPVRRMPDGASVGLVGITFHNPQAVAVGSAWDRLLAFGRTAGAASEWRVTLPGDEAPIVWLGYSRGYFWRNSDFPRTVLRSSSGDEWLGERAGGGAIGSPLGESGSPFAELEGRSFDIFPRRQRLLTLRIYQHTGGWGPAPERWVDFSVPNPAFRKYPTWTPEPFPVVRRSGDLKVALTSLRTGVEFPTGSTPAPMPSQAATFATFHLTRNDAPAPEWEPVELAYSDATGNQLSGYEDRLTRNGDEIGFPLYGQLPSDESAWKVRAEFSRCHSQSAKPDHLWTVPYVPVPRFDADFGWQSIRVAPGMLLLTQLGCKPTSGAAILNVRLQARAGRNLRLVLRGVDDAGRSITEDDARWKTLRGGEMPEWQLTLSPKVRSLHLTLSGFESRTVEFLARATRVR